MPRSLKKGPFVDEHLAKKVTAQNEAGTHNVIKTWSRRSMVTPDMIGHTRRPQARPGFRDRIDGWAQARRVRPDQDLQGSREGR